MSEATPGNSDRISAPTVPQSGSDRSGFVSKALRSVVLLVVLGGVVTLFAVMALGVRVPGLSAATSEKTVPLPPGLGVTLVNGKPHTLRVPEAVRATLGIREGKQENVVSARRPTEGRPLVLSGSTALDPTNVKRIRARFAPAEVVRIGEMFDANLSLRKGHSVKRELRAGDQVSAEEVLGVFYSVDVGNKKNDLFDALVQFKLDQEVLDRAWAKQEVVPEVFILNAQRNVQGDRNAINRAENTLRAWGVPEEDIRDVHREARKATDARGTARSGTENPEDKQKVTAAQLERWARVTLKAPDSGVIVERNVTKNEMVVDNTVSLFQIAKVDRLLVVANAPEDELPQLLALQSAGRDSWVIRTVGASDQEEGIEGSINDISYLIDVNQHSVVVKGYIDNPKNQLRAGQFVTATIDLSPPDGVVEVPVSAVVDDGRECVVFVQTDAKEHHYMMRRVEVTHRYEKVLFVRSRPFAKGAEIKKQEKKQGLLPREPLLPGERVLTTGVLELKKELEDREINAAKKELRP
jgi:cobalt-zinc-cadmium efflux system membrane fusion protein